jgi:hypothetical protein
MICGFRKNDYPPRFGYRGAPRLGVSPEALWGRMGPAHDSGQRTATSAQRYTPHPDALKIEAAVGNLRPVDIDWRTRGRFILDDLFGILGLDGLAPRDVYSLAHWNEGCCTTFDGEDEADRAAANCSRSAAFSTRNLPSSPDMAR